MTYLIGLLLLALVGCAVTIYRLSGEKETVAAINRELATDNHYLRERNKALNAELLMRDVTHTASTSSREDGENRSIVVFPSVTSVLRPEHLAKRKPKSIRGKRK